MDKNKIGETLSSMSPALKKELLDRLVTSLLSDLNEQEKKELLQTVLTGSKKNRKLIDMVEY
jgi:hypothetical protein